jgi:hypothetical protein
LAKYAVWEFEIFQGGNCEEGVLFEVTPCNLVEIYRVEKSERERERGRGVYFDLRGR